MIHITHPDAATCRAIETMLKTVWPEAGVVVCLPGEVPEDALRMPLESPPQRLEALIAKIQTMQRQDQWPASLKFETANGTCLLNTRTREWQKDGEEMILTEKEVGVLLYLWQKKIPVTREDLLRDIWQYASDADTHTIETHIYRLRQKIETDPANPQFLITGKDGYQLAAI